MGNDEHIRRDTADELRAMVARGKSRSDLPRVAALTEAELEQAIAEDPDSDPPPLESPLGWPPFAEVVRPKAPKRLVSLRLDADVLEHFRTLGPGWQTRINRVLLNHVRLSQAATHTEPRPAKPRSGGD